MIKAPCQNCKNRHKLCWSACQAYIEYRKALDAIRKQREQEAIMNQYLRERSVKNQHINLMAYDKRRRKKY